MNVALSDALKDVDLESGETYRCQVGGRWIELRVLPEGAEANEAETMLEPWTEFPFPDPQFCVRPTRGGMPPVDIPEMFDNQS